MDSKYNAAVERNMMAGVIGLQFARQAFETNGAFNVQEAIERKVGEWNGVNKGIDAREQDREDLTTAVAYWYRKFQRGESIPNEPVNTDAAVA